MIEVWKQIPEQPNYEVSCFGKVRNKKTNKLLKIIIDSRGYGRVYLSYKGMSKRKSTCVHRLVFTMFERTIPAGYHVDHIDGNKLNNSIINLRCCTPSENYRNTTSRSSSGYKGVYKQRNSNKCNGMVLLPIRESAEEAAKDYNLAIAILAQYDNFKSLTYNRLNFGEYTCH